MLRTAQMMARRACTLGTVAIAAGGCSMSQSAADSAAREALDRYARSYETRSPQRMNDLLALDDPRFGQFDAVSSGLLNADQARIENLILRNLSEPRMRFEDVRAAPLATDVVLVTAILHGTVGGVLPRESFANRATFVLVRSGGNWRIVHAHLSAADECQPAQDGRRVVPGS